jgi:lycopene cyclase domain-containing protein
VAEVTYLVIVLAFAVPIIAAQWLIGWQILLLEWRPIVATVVMATLYLGFADMAALHDGIWSVAPSKRLGVDHGSFIIEEWLLILATNTIIAQTVTLALDADVRERVVRFWRQHRR